MIKVRNDAAIFRSSFCYLLSRQSLLQKAAVNSNAHREELSTKMITASVRKKKVVSLLSEVVVILLLLNTDR